MNEENKRRTMILTLVAIAILLVAVVGATYAYFRASGYATKTSTVNVTTRAVDSIACTSNNLSMVVEGDDMSATAGTAAGALAKSSTSTITCTATKATNDASTDKCTMNVTYTPSTAFAHSANCTGNCTTKELTLSVSAAASTGTTANNTLSEKDMSTYTGTSTYNVINGLTWSFTANSVLTITFTEKMYNYNFDQSDLAGKTIAAGTLATASMSCAYQ